MPYIFGAKEDHTAGVAATTPTEGAAGTLSPDRDGVWFTNCSANDIFVEFNGTPTTVAYDIKLSAGQSFPVDLRGPFQVIASAASSTLRVRPYTYNRSQGTG